MVGAGTAQGSAYEVQRRYDYAYMQCMYAAGDRVPVPGGARRGGYGYGGYGGGGYAPDAPPPPGMPPPPPPGAY